MIKYRKRSACFATQLAFQPFERVFLTINEL